MKLEDWLRTEVSVRLDEIGRVRLAVGGTIAVALLLVAAFGNRWFIVPAFAVALWVGFGPSPYRDR